LLAGSLKDGSQWASSESVQCFTAFAGFNSTSTEDAARVLAALRSNPLEFGQGGVANEAVTKVNRFMVPLALRSGNRQEIDRLVKDGGDSFRGDLDFMIRLWRGGHSGSAVSLIARPGEYHKGMKSLLLAKAGGDSKPLVFTREIEDGLPGWLASIPDPAQRFRMECLISAAADAEDERAPALNRNARIEALVKRFPAEAPKPRVSRSETLAALCNEPGAAKILAGDIMEAVGKQSLGMLIPMRDGNNSSGTTDEDAASVVEALIIRAMQYALEEDGDLAFSIAQFESIVPVPIGNQAYLATEMLNSLGSWYSGLLLKRITDVPAGKRPELAGHARSISGVLFEKGRNERDGGKQVAVALAHAAQALAGDGNALDVWLQGFSKDSREEFDNSTRGEGLRDVMEALRNPALAGEANNNRRRSLLTALITEPAISARLIRHITDLSVLMDSRVFSKEDIYAVIDALPETHPRRAEYLCEKAGIIGWRGGTPEDALKTYDLAEAAAAGEPKSVDFVKSYRVMFLDHIKRTADALIIAKSINLDHLPARERKTVEGVLGKSPATKDPKDGKKE
jgi:hypothetical protein